MAIKTKNGYECGYCGQFFTDPVLCDVHKEEHKLIYLPISQEDLNRLVNFIYSKEDKLLTEALVSRLQRYLKGSFDLDLFRDKGK